MVKQRKNSTKKDYVPTNDELRRQLIEQFLQENGDDPEMFQEHAAVPFEGSHIVRSTSGRKGPKH
jgi:hypothetical protein